MFIQHYAPNRCEPRIKVIVKISPSKSQGGGGDVNDEKRQMEWGGGGGIEVIVKMKQVAQRAKITHLRTSIFK